jgi:hypothetical protein
MPKVYFGQFLAYVGHFCHFDCKNHVFWRKKSRFLLKITAFFDFDHRAKNIFFERNFSMQNFVV